MKKKTKDKDVWVYSAVGSRGCGTSNVFGICEARSKEEAVGYAVNQLKKHKRGSTILMVDAAELDLEKLK